MVIPLTKKEKMVLEFIRVYSELHGFSPSLAEIAEHFELRAVSTVHEHIANLKKKGYISKETSQTRSLQLIDAILAGQDVLEIPLGLELNEEAVLSEAKGKTKSVYLHHSQLADKGKYFGVLIKCSSYEYLGINSGDAMILKEEENYKTGDKVLACIDDKSYYLGKIVVYTPKNKSLEKFDCNKIRIRNFKPKARLIGLFRDFCPREN